MKNVKNTVIIDLHPDKILNGSTFYAFEYFMMLNSKGCDTSRLVIYVPDNFEETKSLIIESFKFKYSCNVHINFCKRRVDVYRYALKSESVLFIDIYSFMNFKDIKVKKFVFSNEFYEEQYAQLNHRIKNTTTFYGFYDYQYHSEGCNNALKINFSLFKHLLNCERKVAYIHLTDPLITQMQQQKIIKSTNLPKNMCLIKDPNQPIKNLFSKLSLIVYYQNSEVIDKNNRTMLEAEYYGINTSYIHHPYSCDNVERLKSRKCKDFTLTEDDLLIQDILNYETT